MSKKHVKQVVDAILALRGLPSDERVALYNAITSTAACIVSDICADPVIAIQLVPTEKVEANDYNPNHVSPPEMDLLEDSIRADGVTMPCVTMRDADKDRWIVIDGFHRRTVIADRLGRSYIPCTVIQRGEADRMASTIRHNRARGKHGVELMGALLRKLMDLGKSDEEIGTALGMSEEEVLRLKQVVGAAKLMAAKEYSKSWGRTDEPDLSGE